MQIAFFSFRFSLPLSVCVYLPVFPVCVCVCVYDFPSSFIKSLLFSPSPTFFYSLFFSYALCHLFILLYSTERHYVCSDDRRARCFRYLLSSNLHVKSSSNWNFHSPRIWFVEYCNFPSECRCHWCKYMLWNLSLYVHRSYRIFNIHNMQIRENFSTDFDLKRFHVIMITDISSNFLMEYWWEYLNKKSLKNICYIHITIILS